MNQFGGVFRSLFGTGLSSQIPFFVNNTEVSGVDSFRWDNPNSRLIVINNNVLGAGFQHISRHSGAGGTMNVFFDREGDNSGDPVGAFSELTTLSFRGMVNGSFEQGARIKTNCSTTWSVSDTGTEMSFYTTPNGTTSEQENLKINNNRTIELGGYTGTGTQIAAFNATGVFTRSSVNVSDVFLQNGNNFGADAVLGTNGVGQNLFIRTAGVNRMLIDSNGGFNIGGSTTIRSGFRHEINGSITGNASFTLTSGATTNTSRTITYAANTVVKKGDSITGTGVPTSNVITNILSSTSAEMLFAATATNSGLTFTINPIVSGLTYDAITTGSSGIFATGGFYNPTVTGTGALKDVIGLQFSPRLVGSNVNDNLIAFDFSRISFEGNGNQCVFAFPNDGEFRWINKGTSTSAFLRFQNTGFGLSFGRASANAATNNFQSTIFGSSNANNTTTIGSGNVIIGKNNAQSVSFTGASNIIIGDNISNSLTTAASNTIIGANTSGLTTGNSNIFISYANNDCANANISSSLAIGYRLSHSQCIGIATGINATFDSGTQSTNEFIMGSHNGGGTSFNIYNWWFGGRNFISSTVTGYQQPLSLNFGNVTSAVGTDISSGARSVTFNGSIGTGTGTSGSFIFATGITGSTGTTPHTRANVFEISQNRNVAFFAASSYGSGNGVMFLGNANTVPSANPTGGGILYVEAGALKYRGSAGTITTIANA